MIKPKIFQIFPPFCVQNYSKNYSPEFSPQENCPLWKSPHGEITPNEIPSPFINHTNERKNKITKFFASCAIQHPYQKNQGRLWYKDDFTENTALRFFLYRVKKIQKSNAGFAQDFKTQKLGDLRVFEEKIHCFWGDFLAKMRRFQSKMRRFLKTLITIVTGVEIVRYKRNNKHNLSFIKCFEPE